MKQNPCKSKESQTKSTLKSKETHTNPKKKKKNPQNARAFMIQI